MQLSDWLRVVVVGGSVVAALGSATSQQPQPTGYYPRPQGAEGPQAAPAPPPAPAPAAAPGTCQAFCDQLARCELSPASDCMDQCRTEGMEQNPNGPQILAEGARSSCEQLAAWSQAAQAQDAPDPAPAAPAPPVSQAPDADAPPHDRAPAQAHDGAAKERPQWTCNATGTWQKCEMQGYHACYSQMQSSIGFGTTEALARLSAQTLCTSAMTSLMSANFTYRTNVMVPCRAISCTAPAKR